MQTAAADSLWQKVRVEQSSRKRRTKRVWQHRVAGCQLSAPGESGGGAHKKDAGWFVGHRCTLAHRRCFLCRSHVLTVRFHKQTGDKRSNGPKQTGGRKQERPKTKQGHFVVSVLLVVWARPGFWITCVFYLRFVENVLVVLTAEASA